jgi:hypothetical protein
MCCRLLTMNWICSRKTKQMRFAPLREEREETHLWGRTSPALHFIENELLTIKLEQQICIQKK